MSRTPSPKKKALAKPQNIRGATKIMKAADPDQEHYELRLYIAGQTAKSLAAFSNLKRICDEHLKDRYTLEVVDLLENPALAMGDQIIAVPTTVRALPFPPKKIIGDLSNTERVLAGLNLSPRASGE